MSTNHEESFEILWARPRLEVIDLPSFISFVKKTNEKCKFLATFYKFRRKQLLPSVNTTAYLVQPTLADTYFITQALILMKET